MSQSKNKWESIHYEDFQFPITRKKLSSSDINKIVNDLILKGNYEVNTLKDSALNENKQIQVKLILENGYQIQSSSNIIYTEESTITELKKVIRFKLEELEIYKNYNDICR